MSADPELYLPMGSTGLKTLTFFSKDTDSARLRTRVRERGKGTGSAFLFLRWNKLMVSVRIIINGIIKF